MLDVTFLLSAFVILLVTIAPFETAPVFVGPARPLSPDDRRRTVRRAVVTFALVGKGLLGLLHVSLPALRTAGGVLLPGGRQSLAHRRRARGAGALPAA